jgi:hypothetical protein
VTQDAHSIWDRISALLRAQRITPMPEPIDPSKIFVQADCFYQTLAILCNVEPKTSVGHDAHTAYRCDRRLHDRAFLQMLYLHRNGEGSAPHPQSSRPTLPPHNQPGARMQRCAPIRKAVAGIVVGIVIITSKAAHPGMAHGKAGRDTGRVRTRRKETCELLKRSQDLTPDRTIPPASSERSTARWRRGCARPRGRGRAPLHQA